MFDVIAAMQLGQCRVVRDVQLLQLVSGAGQRIQFYVVRNVQRGQQVVVAVQYGQRRVVGDVQLGQLVVAALGSPGYLLFRVCLGPDF